LSSNHYLKLSSPPLQTSAPAPDRYRDPNDSSRARRDDPINKTAARQALATLGRASVQYLLPPTVARDTPAIDLGDFLHRSQAALKDLISAHSGRFEGLKEAVMQSPRALLRSLTDAVRAHGFHLSIFHTLVRSDDGDGLPVRPDWGIQDADNPGLAEWHAAYVRQHLYRGDPMFLASVDAVRPLVSAWDFETGRVFGDVQRPLGAEEFGLARDGTRITGARSGVTVPINNARGEAGLIVFLSAAGGAQAATAHRAALGRLAELSASFHNAIRHYLPRKEDPTPFLDEREIACLRLLARGCTIANVAGELAMAPRNIVGLLASAGRKLGSASRFQTLARAVAAGYIKL
jgi:DNA-binding CsgD family transcriptional regulator